MKALLRFSLSAIVLYALFLTGCSDPNSPHNPESQNLFKIEPVIEDLTTDLVLIGSGMISAGTGLESQPGTIEINVPDVVIEKVLIYWAMRDRASTGTIYLTGDNQITVGGVPVIGEHIGGPHTGTDIRNFSFRADITGLNLVQPNMNNSISVTDMEGQFKTGAAIVVIYDDGTEAFLEIRDGLDFAYLRNNPQVPELLVTNLQTFNFPAASSDRTAALTIFVGDVHDEVSGVVRPHYLEYSVGGGGTVTINEPFSSADGNHWDTYVLSVNIPAGETSVSIRLFSGPEDNPVNRNPSSLLWVAAGLSVPVPGDGGCTRTPGYWKTHSIFGPAPYDNTWALIGENTTFFHSGQSYYEAINTSSAGGNGYYILAQAYIAAELNQLAGTSIPIEVLTAFNHATDLFNNPANTPVYIGSLKGNNSLRQDFINTATILDNYNNGITGPGHCD